VQFRSHVRKLADTAGSRATVKRWIEPAPPLSPPNQNYREV
jgi:hypothetical protein